MFSYHNEQAEEFEETSAMGGMSAGKRKGGTRRQARG